MADVTTLQQLIEKRFPGHALCTINPVNELTVEIPAEQLLSVCQVLRDDEALRFEILVDLCGVDYSHYGVSEWQTEKATEAGFERGVIPGGIEAISWKKPRFAVVYHLLSVTHNHRIRLRVFAEGETPLVDSVVDIWNCANWYEREAFDLYGIIFKGHPDLRRLLTDYGFVGYPFRKDFPLIGQVEVRYDAAAQRVIYEPVSIEPRVLVPRVIRNQAEYPEPQQPQPTTGGQN